MASFVACSKGSFFLGARYRGFSLVEIFISSGSKELAHWDKVIVQERE